MKPILTAAMLLLASNVFAQKSNDVSLNFGRSYTRYQNSGPVTSPTIGAFNSIASVRYLHTKGRFVLGGEVGMARLYDYNYVNANYEVFEGPGQGIFRSKSYISAAPEIFNFSVIGGMQFGAFKVGVKAGVSLGTDIWRAAFIDERTTPVGGNAGLYFEYVKYFGRFGAGVSATPTVHVIQSKYNQEFSDGHYTIYTVPVSVGVHYRF